MDGNHLGRRFGLEPHEYALLKSLRSPAGVQRFLDDDVGYNKERGGDTCRSPRRVLRDRLAQCFEGALFAAAALRVIGYPPLLLDLEAVRDADHVVALFRSPAHRCWGAVAKSNFAGLRFREPVYRSLRELAMSYFEDYYNLDGEKTLRTFSTRAVSLVRFDRIRWMTTEEDLWGIAEYLTTIAHTRVLPAPGFRLSKKDERSYRAGLTGRA